MKSIGSFGAKASASLTANRGARSGARIGGVFHVECIRPDGSVRWVEEAHNLVTDEGLQHLLDILFVSATSQVDPWYVGLLAATPSPAANWNAASVGSADFVAYTESALQAFVDVRSSQSVGNAASKASFAINADTSSIGGAFLISTSAKATPAGTVLCAVAFTGGNKAADSGDTLNVTYTFSAADDGA